MLNLRSLSDIIVFYRPPPSPVNKLTSHQFLSEWEEFMLHCAISISELVIMGDANLHLDDMTLRNMKDIPTHFRK